MAASENLFNILKQKIQDIFGGGAVISAANPLPVDVVGAIGTLTQAPFTDTGDIAPAVVQAAPAADFKAVSISIHWAGAVTSNPVTIALDSGQGADYDTPLQVIPMGAIADLNYVFPANAKYLTGDVITVAWIDDTVGAATWGVIITTEEG